MQIELTFEIIFDMLFLGDCHNNRNNVNYFGYGLQISSCYNNRNRAGTRNQKSLGENFRTTAPAEEGI